MLKIQMMKNQNENKRPKKKPKKKQMLVTMIY